MGTQHAILSASSSHRWLNCTPSARLELEFEDTESEAAREGTAAHALCEHKLKVALNRPTKRPTSRFDCDEMERHTDDYVAFVLEQLDEAHDPILLIEQRLDFSCYVPDGFGTGDVVIVGDGLLSVIDFKYGQGVLVEAEDNPQMKLYALGALRLYEPLYDILKVAMTIYQPRRENVSTWTIPVDELKSWAQAVLVPRAKLAHTGEGDYCAGEWCTFCRAAVKCRARAEAKLSLARYEFARPPLLTDAEVGDILARLDDLTKWANDILAYATQTALHQGKQWPGYKLVEGRSVRKYTDENQVAAAVKAAGHTDIYKQNLIPLTEMERMLGKEPFNRILSGLIEKPPGRPTLVPLTDKRPPIRNEFMEVAIDEQQ